ncbi:MAG: hypothetical protein NE334_17520 [Lentisphaeraceae bacterium]|nr:hypothetical protein [Lentisphaeraceae bacterium]
MKFLNILLISCLLFSTVVLAEKSVNSTSEKLLADFQKLLIEKNESGDSEAQLILAKARQNKGKIALSFDEMKKLMIKWQPTSKKLFEAGLYADEVQKVKEQFEALLAAKIKSLDDEALEISKKAQESKGKMTFSVKDMKRYISKWTKK